jgi:hypothetical protein
MYYSAAGFLSFGFGSVRIFPMMSVNVHTWSPLSVELTLCLHILDISISTIIIFLDIIHHPILLTHNFSEKEYSLQNAVF